ncbi:MAG: hypothetical protein RQ748_05840 [Elusimicrobiales bacterium]|nr:hypothetical protein [Elusimicrobiales bacterium]
MHRNAIILAAAVMMSAASASHAQDGALEKLNTATLKIAEIDMDKNYGAAGEILDGFYTGHGNKKNSSRSVVYLNSSQEQEAPPDSRESICNSAPHKVRKLASRVPPVQSGAPANPEHSGKLPLAGGLLAAGTIALGAAGIRKEFWDDVQTVADAVANPIETYNDFQAANAYEQSQQSSQPNLQHSASTNTVVNVSESSGTVAISTSPDNSCIQSDPACIGSGFVYENLPPYPRP